MGWGRLRRPRKPADAVQVMSENPYRLARDIRGIGFKTADAIAIKLGIEKTAMVRVRKAVAIAVRNVSGRRRWSKLAEWLASTSRGR
jgi:hypothetical protein